MTKQLAKFFLEDNISSVDWFFGLLTFEYHTNDGASYNLFSGQQWLFALITLFALVLFGYFFLSISFKNKKVYSIAIILFIAGTLGNAIDRLIYGFVIDFIQYNFLSAPLNLIGLGNFWNNFADLYLTFAIVLYAIDIFFLESKRKKGSELNHEKMDD